MTKFQAIQLCKSLLSRGIYSRPVEHPLTREWAIIVLHDVNSFGFELEGYYFVDCWFYKWEGLNKTVDFPIFAMK